MNEKINVGGYQMINLENADLASGAVIKGIFKLITATEKPILLSSMRFEQTTLKPQFANFWHSECLHSFTNKRPLHFNSRQPRQRKNHKVCCCLKKGLIFYENYRRSSNCKLNGSRASRRNRRCQ